MTDDRDHPFPPRSLEDLESIAIHRPPSGSASGQYQRGRDTIRQDFKKERKLKEKSSWRAKEIHIHQMMGKWEFLQIGADVSHFGEELREKDRLINQLKAELDNHYSGKNLVFISLNVIALSCVIFLTWKLTDYVLVDPYLNTLMLIGGLVFLIIGVSKKSSD